MEAHINVSRQNDVSLEEQFGVDQSDAEIQHRNDDLERRSHNCDAILDFEQSRAEGQVGQDATDKGKQRCRQPYDGEELKVPSVSICKWGVPYSEEMKIVTERCCAQDVKQQRERSRGRRQSL